MGGDEAYLVTDEALAGADEWATARVLAAALDKLAPDVSLMGMASDDARGSLVPGAVAAMRGLPLLSYGSELRLEDGVARIRRLSSTGFEIWESPLPAVVSVTDQVGEPRYASLKGIMAAKRKPLETWALGDLGLAAADLRGAALTRVTAAEPPEAKPPTERIEGIPPTRPREDRRLAPGSEADLMASDIYFLAEYAEGSPSRSAIELRPEPQTWRQQSGGAAVALAYGRGAGEVPPAWAPMARQRAIVLGDEERPAITFAASAIAAAVRDAQPLAVLAPATPNGRDLAAALVGVPRPAGFGPVRSIALVDGRCAQRAGNPPGQHDHHQRAGGWNRAPRSCWCCPAPSAPRSASATAELVEPARVEDGPFARVKRGRASSRRGCGREPGGGDRHRGRWPRVWAARRASSSCSSSPMRWVAPLARAAPRLTPDGSHISSRSVRLARL